MSWEARKYKDIIDTLTCNIDQLESNLKAIEGYLHIIDSKTCNQLPGEIKRCNQLLKKIKDNLNDTKSDIKDLKGTTEALQNTIKDNNYELSRVLEVE